MTTALIICNTKTGDARPPSPGIVGASPSGRCGPLRFFGTRKVTLRGPFESSRVLPYLVGESDDFENRNRLNWWSYGAFASKGQLHGNQYLAGRRAPPLLPQ